MYGFWTYLGMCFIAKAVFILAIYNASKPCFDPFVSDIGNSNWFKYQISEPTSRGLLTRGATCLNGFPTYLQGTVCRDRACLYGLCISHQGIVCQGCSLFPNYLKVTPVGCWPHMQPVYTISNTTNMGMLVRGVACLYGFKTYLTGTIG